MTEPQVPETRTQFETFLSNLVVDTKEAKTIEELWNSFNGQQTAVKILQTALQAGAKKSKKETDRLEVEDRQESKMAEQQIPESHQQFQMFMSKLAVDAEEAKVIEKLWSIFHDNQTATKNLQIAVLQSTARNDRKEINKLQTMIDNNKIEIQKLRYAASNDENVIYTLQKHVDKKQIATDGLRYDFDKLAIDARNKISKLEESIQKHQVENDTLRCKLEKLELEGSNEIDKLQECIVNHQAENSSLRVEVSELRLERFVQEVALKNYEIKIKELTCKD